MTKKLTIISLCSLLFLILPNFAFATDKLLQLSDLTYLGAFRVPKTVGFLIGGGSGFTFDPSGNGGSGSFFISGSGRMVGEISLPSLVNTTNINEMNTSNILQNPVDIGSGHNTNANLGGDSCDNGCGTQGILIYNDKIVGAMSTTYDANGSQAYSHFTNNKNLTVNNFAGMYRVGQNPVGGNNGGLVGGYMTSIPDNTLSGGLNWQNVLGGVALTGQGFSNIITRTSNGPCAFAFDPGSLGSVDPTPATMLVGYPNGHWNLGAYGVTNQYMSIADRLTSVVFPKGSKSVIFFGKHGSGVSCYGEGTGNQAQEKSADDLVAWFLANGTGLLYTCGSTNMTYVNAQSGDGCCYDPVDGSKGIHSYPYHYYGWAYDANDFADVKNALKNPWDIFPYQVWNMDSIFSSFPPGWGYKSIKGASYDSVNRILYLLQEDGDKYSVYDSYPLVHAFELNLDPQSPDTSPPTAPSGLNVL